MRSARRWIPLRSTARARGVSPPAGALRFSVHPSELPSSSVSATGGPVLMLLLTCLLFTTGTRNRGFPMRRCSLSQSMVRSQLAANSSLCYMDGPQFAVISCFIRRHRCPAGQHPAGDLRRSRLCPCCTFRGPTGAAADAIGSVSV